MKSKLSFLLLAWVSLSVPALAAIIDDFNGNTFNAGGAWVVNNKIQGGGAQGNYTYDQTTNPGKLTVIQPADQLSEANVMTLRNDIALDVGKFLQAKVAILQGGGNLVFCGLGLAPATNPTDRSNTLWYPLRGDGVARANAFQNGGAEFSDPAGTIPSYQAGVEYTLRIVRSAEAEYQLYWGTEGTADQFVATITWPEGATPPTVPGLMIGNGSVGFQATVEDFEIGDAGPIGPTPTPTPEPTPFPTPPAPNVTIDDFEDGSFSTHWNGENYPQRTGELDTHVLTESNGKLTIDVTEDQGSVQVTFYLRDDVTLEIGDTVQVDVRVIAGATDPLVRVGLGLATVSSGIDNDRSNTLWYGLRNDGIMRGNAYGDGGAEIGGVEPALESYSPGGDVLTVLIHRVDENRYTHWYGQNGPPETYAGVVNFAGFTPPTVPGLFIGVGLSNMTLEFDNFRMFKSTIPNAAGTWTIY